MQHTKNILRPSTVVDSVICDKCEREFKVDTKDGCELAELNEMLHIRMQGGFASIFGEGTKLELDLCQNCMNELLGIYFRYSPSNK